MVLKLILIVTTYKGNYFYMFSTSKTIIKFCFLSVSQLHFTLKLYKKEQTRNTVRIKKTKKTKQKKLCRRNLEEMFDSLSKTLNLRNQYLDESPTYKIKARRKKSPVLQYNTTLKRNRNTITYSNE